MDAFLALPAGAAELHIAGSGDAGYEALLRNQTAQRASEYLENLRAKYQAMPREVASKGLRFHQLRERARHGLKR